MRYIALLRGMNVGGGHVVKMDRLRALFTSLGLARVETFIASGNVIFESRSRGGPALERRLEEALEGELGYAVSTMVRSDAELAAVAAYEPFPRDVMARARTFNVGFLKAPLSPRAAALLPGYETPHDAFHTAGREFYWMCQTLQSQSTFFKVNFEKVFGTRVTFRSISTVRKLVERYPPGRLAR